MTTKQFRQLRRFELICFFRRRYGRCWQTGLTKELKCNWNAPIRWYQQHRFAEKLNEEFESFAYGKGFVSSLDKTLLGLSYQVILLEKFEKIGRERREARGFVDELLPFEQDDVDELAAAFGWDLSQTNQKPPVAKITNREFPGR